MNQHTTTQSALNHSLRKVVDAVDSLISEPSEDQANYGVLRRQREMLMVGIGWEIPVIRPSYPELGAAVGCSHSTAMNHLEAWQRMPWQDRYGWLRLVDGRLRNEADAVDAVVL